MEGVLEVADENGEVTEAIEQLRSQLLAVQEGGRESNMRFVVTEVEMEFLLEVRREGGASGGVRLGLVSIGADGKLSRGTSHTLKLKLDVRDRESGDQAIVSDRR
jgi:hypothetical protein